ncbi:hypothetical protein AAEO50_18650 [Rossellomorea oryzaecorticis]|uniref:Ribosomal protein S14 n=1 Tax=Rossellomorea oryzaecorticis TaxID=1396505 RepID=A0ABU9KDX5_9BACI
MLLVEALPPRRRKFDKRRNNLSSGAIIVKVAQLFRFLRNYRKCGSINGIPAQLFLKAAQSILK